MRALVRASLVDPVVRGKAVELASGERPGHSGRIVSALEGYGRAVFHFTRDPHGVELLHTPAWMLREIAQRGKTYVDCDDAALLLAALGEAVGIPARFVAVAFFDRAAPYSHVWVELFDGRGWRILDPTRGSQPLDVTLVTRIMTLDV